VKTRRYILAVGLASSEVGGLMALHTVVAPVTGSASWSGTFDVVLIIGLGTWLWLKRSLTAALLIFVLVAAEYCYLAISYGRSNTWLATYLCLFLVAVSIHVQGRKKVGSGGVRMLRSDRE
jgi:hypothetical protein